VILTAWRCSARSVGGPHRPRLRRTPRETRSPCTDRLKAQTPSRHRHNALLEPIRSPPQMPDPLRSRIHHRVTIADTSTGAHLTAWPALPFRSTHMDCPQLAGHRHHDSRTERPGTWCMPRMSGRGSHWGQVMQGPAPLACFRSLVSRFSSPGRGAFSLPSSQATRSRPRCALMLANHLDEANCDDGYLPLDDSRFLRLNPNPKSGPLSHDVVP
jgi:hypothetical protein